MSKTIERIKFLRSKEKELVAEILDLLQNLRVLCFHCNGRAYIQNNMNPILENCS